jgi:hypothetical protein
VQRRSGGGDLRQDRHVSRPLELGDQPSVFLLVKGQVGILQLRAL